MVTYQEALGIIKKYLNIDQDASFFIMEDKTVEFEYGWVFFYQTTDYIEINGVKVGLGGNAPYIVDKRDGSVHVTGTAYPHQKYINDYIEKVKHLGE
ncbi:YrhB domain-containing protein [Chitinophaga tropicalis]|uniref:Immunity protein 35 domain-containing protein n=1 Tax=Chitinophaga tropicalis TaxID=2683588 RepID=A0A7K1U0S5_9BACT|nr:YrhB domain-containing protein [Chitinophaga tropicalis]MVT07974.1 hypothetical protein [Chitinophaga tropicalis]